MSIALLKRAWCEWSNHNAMRLAAATAFYTMMSLAPMLVVALTILTLAFHTHAEKEIEDASRILGDQAGEAIRQMLSTMTHNGSNGIWATIVSFTIALVSGSTLFVSLQESINTIWDVKPRPNAGWKAIVLPRIVSVLVLFGAGAILLASLVLSTVLTVVVHHLPGWLSWGSFVGEMLISVVVVGLLFALAYKILPSVEVKWNDVWLGAALAAVLFLLGKYGLTLYFRFASIKPFGAAGSLAALLIWVYYSSAIFFFGAAFARAYAERDGKDVPPDKFGAKFMTKDQDSCGEP